MNYERIYNELIKHRQVNKINKIYTEDHHIIPKCLGGTDDPSNLVRLTFREHFIAHLLLHKIHKTSKTAFALNAMKWKTNESRSIKNSRMYDWIKKEFVKYLSKNAKITSKGERNSQFGKMWISNLELQENKKILKSEEIPQGWAKGRNIWNKKQIKPREYINIQEGLKLFYKFIEGDYLNLKDFSQKENLKFSIRAYYILWKKHIPDYNYQLKEKRRLKKCH